MQVGKDRIVLNKVLNNLDIFTIDFINILQQHIEYVLVSGYVSILFGRSRISEDIDLLIPKITQAKFQELHKVLQEEFWCLNADDDLYSLLCSKHSIRYARKDKVIPNMEIKFANTVIDNEALNKKICVTLQEHTLFVSPIELQIIYKEQILKSAKDIEDALHLREVFKDELDMNKIKYYEELVKVNG